MARIRLAQSRDAERIAEIYRPVVEATAISFETEVPGREEIERRLAEAGDLYPWLVCEIGDQIAGYAYATRHRVREAYRWSVDTSVYVDTHHRRSGVGCGLYTSLFRILRAQGYVNAYAGIALPNPGSVALHESVGFTPVGVYRRVGYKLGAWHDVGWWQLALQVHDDAPADPLDLQSVARRTDWHALVSSGESSVRSIDRR